MGSLLTFALGAVSALVLVPLVLGGRRSRHRHGGPVLKRTGGKIAGKGGKRGR